MKLTQRQYPEWKAPAQDSETLIWPEPRELLQQTLENHRALKNAVHVRIQNLPLPEIRSAMRGIVGHADEHAFIASGHQTELYHAGVWAKHALINAAAETIGGAAFHLAVDTDAPKHLHLRWPGGSVAITDDPKLLTAAWSGQVAPPSTSYLDEISNHFHNATGNWPFKPAAGAVLASLGAVAVVSHSIPAAGGVSHEEARRLNRAATPESATPQTSTPQSLARAIISANQVLDESLGLRHRTLLASPIWMSRPFLVFAHDLLANAAKFSKIYNQALQDYRELHHIKTAMRPMPDLFTSHEAIEAPFWLDNLADGTRSRPSVFSRDDGFVLELLSGEEFHFDPHADGWTASRSLQDFLETHQLRLSPRALTLTLFARVCLADNFVHGIGGARYDQVTDRIIENYFHLECPAFAVSTATLYLPQALTRARICMPCIVHEGHQLKHRVLGDEKAALVKAMESLPRHSRERGRLFTQMHQQLRERQDHPAVSNWKIRLSDAHDSESENAVFFDRELFYAMQPKSRLASLIQRYRDAFI